ncbi:MAG: NTPase [Candidatus Omnitrophica bacterium]|nr:NTPase [Candidatus Omnitrophota bacterium]
MKVKNILITGKPGCGKTTLIKDLICEINCEKVGFFTEEIREQGKRIGFKIITLSGKSGILASESYKTSFKVSRYYVSLQTFEELGVKELEEGLKKDCLIVIDEIGKMELFSEKFREILFEVLESKNKVLGTIMFKSHPVCDRIKKREDTKVFILERENYPVIKQEVLKILKN